MREINFWLKDCLELLDKNFGDRLWFVGLQGSHGRGEAGENSDIDLVVILDEISSCDIKTYDGMLDSLPHRELVCGFISGKSELFGWDPSELFHLYHDTTPIRGSLEDIKPLIDGEAVERAIRIGAGSIYHSCSHNMLHEKSNEILKDLYKAASFVVKAVVYRQTGEYFGRATDIHCVLSPEERKIFQTYLAIKNGEELDFNTMSEELFNWSKGLIGE